MDRTLLFDGYADSIFTRSNTLTKEEYERSARNYRLNYAAFLPADKASRILDVGCGAGHFLYFLKQEGYTNFTGVDISATQLDLCRKHVCDRVEQADVFDFLARAQQQQQHGRYDAIVANDVLEHFPKDRVVPFLKLAHAALAAGGVLLLKTINMGNPFSSYIRCVDFTHEVGFTDKSMYQILSVAGFQKIELFGLRYPRGLKLMRMRLLHFLVRKCFWYQGFVAPDILTSLIVAAATK